MAITATFDSENRAQHCIEPVVISGPESYPLANMEYVNLSENGKLVKVFEIKYEYHCSPFNEARVIGNLLAVGHEGFFYLFDLNNNMNILSLEMEGYFGHMYQDGNLIYVADAGSLHCINHKGMVLWQNTNLGIDGVIIHEIDQDKIYGDGEWDPPGGWIGFLLDKQTGRKID